MEALAKYAATWLGYRNKRSDSQLNNKTANTLNDYNGYTIFGNWYGINPGAWCAMFVCYCADKVGCLDAIGGKTAWVPDFVSRFKSWGKWSKNPHIGDLIILGDADHIGIVSDVRDTFVWAIEGNANGGMVAENSYHKYSSYIMGYCNVDSVVIPKLNISQGIYKNGSTPETVYTDYHCTIRAGELNKYEQCTKIGTLGDKTIVLYPVDDTDNYKCGFVVYGGT